MKTSELTGAALDWAVATANGDYPQWDAERKVFYTANGDDMSYSTNPSQAHPIIERGGITVGPTNKFNLQEGHEKFTATLDCPNIKFGETPLIAAMRCYVASKLGDEVEIPEELT